MNVQGNPPGVIASLLGCLAGGPAVWGQARALPKNDVPAIYQRLMTQIEKIPIVDMHAHPGYWDDSDVDAMAVTPTELDPMRTRPSNPEWAAEQRQYMVTPILIARLNTRAGSTTKTTNGESSMARNISREFWIAWAFRYRWRTA